MIDITDSQLQIISNLTLELVKLRQNECKHLCVENLAPNIFESLLSAIHEGSQIVIPITGVETIGVVLSHQDLSKVNSGLHDYLKSAASEKAFPDD